MGGQRPQGRPANSPDQCPGPRVVRLSGRGGAAGQQKHKEGAHPHYPTLLDNSRLHSAYARYELDVPSGRFVQDPPLRAESLGRRFLLDQLAKAAGPLANPGRGTMDLRRRIPQNIKLEIIWGPVK